jgi:hypothetical protein
MLYNFNGKTIKIDDNEIIKLTEKLDLTQDEAIQMWLEDNDYLENEEQTALDEKASKVKVSVGARSSAPTKEKKPRTTKVSDEKKTLFAEILSDLEDVYKGNVTVLKENKLIEVKMGGKTFKIDIIEQRPPKK